MEEKKEEKSVGGEGRKRKEGEERRRKEKTMGKYFIASQNICFLSDHLNII